MTKSDIHLSLVRGDAWDRAQRTLRLFPRREGKDGVLRRTVIFTLVAWLPLLLSALATGRAFTQTAGEPLLWHLAIHARFLIALPALIYGERVAHSVMKRLVPRFISMGLVAEEKIPAFDGVLAGVARLRNSALPWWVIGALMVVTLLIPDTSRRLGELDWARESGELGFGAWWYLCVSRPILQVFMLAWLWRIVLATVLLRRIAKLGLEPVATHPDGLGGLGFIEDLPRAFVPLAFAMSCVLSAQCAHDVAWHGVHVVNLKLQAGVFGALVIALCLAPLMTFVPLLKKTKRIATAEYAAMSARHARMVHRRWIQGKQPAEGESAEASELGSSTDRHGLYKAVRAMRIIPCSSRTLLGVAVPVALPMLAVGAIEIPVLELAEKILKTVF